MIDNCRTPLLIQSYPKSNGIFELLLFIADFKPNFLLLQLVLCLHGVLVALIWISKCHPWSTGARTICFVGELLLLFSTVMCLHHVETHISVWNLKTVLEKVRNSVQIKQLSKPPLLYIHDPLIMLWETLALLTGYNDRKLQKYRESKSKAWKSNLQLVHERRRLFFFFGSHERWQLMRTQEPNGPKSWEIATIACERTQICQENHTRQK